MAFVKATKQQSKLKLAITGPSGSGKTYTALALASGLVGEDGKIAVLDTEHGSASLYADSFSFDTDPSFCAPWHPDKFSAGIKAAAEAGYDCVIIDSLSHAWSGEGGMLAEVDNIQARQKGGSSFTAWKGAAPIQQRMIEAIVGAPIHVIATMRSKTEYILEEQVMGGRKVQVPRKIGMAPVQRDGVEYEFTLVIDMDLDHRGVVNKSRCHAVADAVILKPGRELAETLRAWLSSGEAPAAVAAPAATAFHGGNGNGGSEEQYARIKALVVDPAVPASWKARLEARLARPMSGSEATQIIKAVEEHLSSGTGA
jgi:hypothetical protein